MKMRYNSHRERERDLTTGFAKSESNSLADPSRSSGDNNHRRLHILSGSDVRLLNGCNLSPNSWEKKKKVPFFSRKSQFKDRRKSENKECSFYQRRKTRLSFRVGERFREGAAASGGLRGAETGDGDERIGRKASPELRRRWRRWWRPLRIWEWFGPTTKRKKKRESETRSPEEGERKMETKGRSRERKREGTVMAGGVLSLLLVSVGSVTLFVCPLLLPTLQNNDVQMDFFLFNPN